MSQQPELSFSSRYLLLAFGVLLFALLSYSFFARYVYFALPAEAGTGLLLLAVMAGLASLFSPCSFPQLVTLLAREAGEFSNRRLLQPVWRTETKLRRRQSSFAFGLYGFIYILAGFGWTGPILAGLALHALTIADETAAFTAFITAAMTIVVVMGLLVIAIGMAQTHTVHSLKGRAPLVKRWGGIMLILVGCWLIALAIWAEAFAQVFPF